MIERGRRVRAALQQPQFQPLTTAHQVLLLQALELGLLDGLAVSTGRHQFVKHCDSSSLESLGSWRGASSKAARCQRMNSSSFRQH